MASGRYWKGIKSIISSHAINEGAMFVNPQVVDESSFSAYYTTGAFANNSVLQALNQRGSELYKSTGPQDTIKDRAAKFVTESSFTCHARAVADAYKGRLYSVVYAEPPSTHGADQCATFLSGSMCSRSLPSDAKEGLEKFQGYQSLLLSFAQTGDPNVLRNKTTTIEWPLTKGFDEAELTDALWVNGMRGAQEMEIKSDPLQSKDRCAFFREKRQEIQKLIDGNSLGGN
jgi:hypothetical protein